MDIQWPVIKVRKLICEVVNTMSEIMIQVEHLKKYYKINENSFMNKNTKYLHAVDDVSLKINKGEIFGVVGESGCGKSTLGRCILRLIDSTEGKVYFKGENITDITQKKLKTRRRYMQMVFQNPYSSFNPKMTIRQSLYEVGKVYKMSRDDTRKKISQLIEYINLSEDVLNRYPNEFSGGQLQRLAIARTLLLEPEFIMADEPVSALDVSVQAQILNLILDLRDKFGLTMMFISHDLTVVEHICDVIAVVYLGIIVEKAPTDELYKNICHPYTQTLISAKPNENPEHKTSRIILKGDLPSAIDIPIGCRFSMRCPKFKKGKCDIETPILKEVSSDHFVACHFV